MVGVLSGVDYERECCCVRRREAFSRALGDAVIALLFVELLGCTALAEIAYSWEGRRSREPWRGADVED